MVICTVIIGYSKGHLLNCIIYHFVIISKFVLTFTYADATMYQLSIKAANTFTSDIKLMGI